MDNLCVPRETVNNQVSTNENGGETMSFLLTAGFILLDMVTGIIRAFKEKEYTSSIMREGLFHKCGSILCVAFGVLVDYSQTVLDLGVSVPVALSICTYIILMEIGSIIENVCSINPEILPDKIKSYFSKLSRKE